MSAQQVGYPCNQDFDYSELWPFLQYSANNVGDPFHGSSFCINTHEVEYEVINTFADMMHLSRDRAWGYVTSGGTEGNMYGLYMGREIFPDGVVYFSQDTHYSVVKIMRLLKARNIMIKSQDNGEIDYDDLYETIRINRDSPVIFMANIGTTMKGAIDDVSRVRAILNDLAVTNSYIHADAALSGMILPFVEEPQPYGFDVGFDSVAISGHKMIGWPARCPVASLSPDASTWRASPAPSSTWGFWTLLSRAPAAFYTITPLMMWYAFERHGLDGFKRFPASSPPTAITASSPTGTGRCSNWRPDHRRHAEIENAIRDLKHGVGLNHLPSGRFAANAAWLAVQVMAHNLARWTARIGLGEQVVTTKTLRRRFFSLAGRITRSARRLTLHLPQRWPWEAQFDRALARLRALPLPA